MRFYPKYVFLFLLAACQSMGSGIPENKMRTDIKESDLDPAAVAAIKENASFYKLPPQILEDYMVAIVRMNIFSSPSHYEIGPITLSFGTLHHKKSFKCDKFFAKLTPEETQVVKSRMAGKPYICENKSYSAEQALKAFDSSILSDKINHPSIADAHWAWHGSNGDTKPLKRLLDNYLYNPNACLECITWSYSSNAQQNHDVLKYLISYGNTKSPAEKERLAELLPK